MMIKLCVRIIIIIIIIVSRYIHKTGWNHKSLIFISHRKEKMGGNRRKSEKTTDKFIQFISFDLAEMREKEEG